MSHSHSEAARRALERRRIVSALLGELERVGPLALRQADVCRRAEISSRSFHRHFDDLDACFDFASEAALDTLLTPLVASWSVPRSPPARLGAALAALLGSLAAEPRLAELCLRHSTRRQPDRRTYRRAVDAVAELLLDLRPEPDAGRSSAGEAALARGAVGLIVARLADGGAEGLEEVHPQLLGLLLPALGLDRAHGLARSDRLEGGGCG